MENNLFKDYPGYQFLGLKIIRNSKTFELQGWLSFKELITIDFHQKLKLYHDGSVIYPFNLISYTYLFENELGIYENKLLERINIGKEIKDDKDLCMALYLIQDLLKKDIRLEEKENLNNVRFVIINLEGNIHKIHKIENNPQILTIMFVNNFSNIKYGVFIPFQELITVDFEKLVMLCVKEPIKYPFNILNFFYLFENEIGIYEDSLFSRVNTIGEIKTESDFHFFLRLLQQNVTSLDVRIQDENIRKKIRYVVLELEKK